MPAYKEVVEFFGHPMVRSAHPTTIEVTKDPRLTINGDCIIGVRADKGISDLSGEVRDALRVEGSSVRFVIEVAGQGFEFIAYGASALPLESTHEMVIRKSEYICGRTLAVRAGVAAKDIPRSIVQTLRSPETKGLLRIEVQI